MVPEVVQVFWAAMARGEFITDAAAEAGTYRKKGARWLAACGGVRPRRGRDLKGRCLTFSEREEIALGRAGGESMRAIAARLGRSPSTVSRELARNAGAAGQAYRATTAHALAYERAGRPKPSKLAVNLTLRRKVQDDLQCRYSPEQIVGRLSREFPDDPEMRVSAETIYQSLYIQSRGALRRDLTKCLRTGRAMRRPCRQPAQRRNRIPDMINISQRPAEADDRAVPGHWEGDLIIGKNNATAIGTLVERTTGYAMLVRWPASATSASRPPRTSGQLVLHKRSYRDRRGELSACATRRGGGPVKSSERTRSELAARPDALGSEFSNGRGVTSDQVVGIPPRRRRR